LLVDKVSRIDARISKSIPIKERYKAMFTFDAFNLLNHRYFNVGASPSIYRIDGKRRGYLESGPGYGAGTAASGFPDGTNAAGYKLGLRLFGKWH